MKKYIIGLSIFFWHCGGSDQNSNFADDNSVNEDELLSCAQNISPLKTKKKSRNKPFADRLPIKNIDGSFLSREEFLQRFNKMFLIEWYKGGIYDRYK